MAINQRLPKSVKDSRELNDAEEKFVGKVERDNLDSLTLDQLAQRFEDIEQQAQLFQGRILLAARNKFESDTLFGQWAARALCSCSPQQRTRLMNLARFFDEEKRPIDKISVTAAYEISAPMNAEIAVEIYEYCRGKNMAVAEVKTLIAKKKGESLPLPVGDEIGTIKTVTESLPVVEDDEIVQKSVEIIEESVKNETVKIGADLESQIMAVVENENPQIAIFALKNVMDKINAKRYRK